jgi:hypothetical protein
MAKEEVKPVPTLWIRLWVSAFDVFLWESGISYL